MWCVKLLFGSSPVSGFSLISQKKYVVKPKNMLHEDKEMINWIFFSGNSSSLHTHTHTHTHTIVHSYVFTSLCLVVASNSGRSPSSWFPNGPRPHLSASNSNSSQLLNRNSPLINSPTISLTPLTHPSLIILLITSRHRPHRKHRSFVAAQLLPRKHACLRNRYLATAVW
jgi:hypothetical protein